MKKLMLLLLFVGSALFTFGCYKEDSDASLKTWEAFSVEIKEGNAESTLTYMTGAPKEALLQGAKTACDSYCQAGNGGHF